MAPITMPTMAPVPIPELDEVEGSAVLPEDEPALPLVAAAPADDVPPRLDVAPVSLGDVAEVPALPPESEALLPCPPPPELLVPVAAAAVKVPVGL